VNPEAQYNYWTSWEPTHIFPLALSSVFTRLGFDAPINSPQNGLLPRTDIQQHWDVYDFSVNPSNVYRIQAFRPNCWYLHGKILDPVCCRPNDNRAVLDALLSWDYEQAVLCNMRGAGEPTFKHDFPPGSDMVGEILKHPRLRKEWRQSCSVGCTVSTRPLMSPLVILLVILMVSPVMRTP
jgi:hypothetical protein